MRIIVVGGGIIGTAHAYYALKAGYQVIHLERDAEPQSASVRNFGLVWVSGRRGGEELKVSIRARELWGEISQDIPELIFRANGSLTLATSEAEVNVMQECLRKEDAGDRGWALLTKEETKKINPVLNGNFIAALWCPLDAAVEPNSVLNSIRSKLMENPNYKWRNHIDVTDVQRDDGKVVAIARNGELFEGDYLILCPGADHTSLFKEQFDSAPIRRVYLQMMNTEIFSEKLTTSIADGDSMRYYPGYEVPALDNLPEQHPVARDNHMQLLLVQRADGTLTIGDTHAYDEPFDFKLDEKPYQYLHNLASELIGHQLPPIAKRWSGVYSQRTDHAICDRRQIAPNIISVTGPGGRGNTLAPAIAEETIKGIA